MWRLKFAIKLLEVLTTRKQKYLTDLNIDDDIILSLKLLHKALARETRGDAR